MNKNIYITLKKELRGIIRDKKSLMMMLITPLFIPFFIFFYSYIYDGMMNDSDTTTYTIGINYELSDIEENIIKDLNLEIVKKDTKEELESEYKNNNIVSYIIKDKNNYKIYTNTSSGDSSAATFLINSYLDSYNKYLASNKLVDKDIDPSSIFNNINIETEELAGANDMVNMVIFLGLVFAMMSICLTGIYGVTDSIAGEKERGTLETILTYPIKNKELITGKYLAVVTSCIITSIICIIFLFGSLAIASNMFDIYKNAVFNINIVSILIGLLIMISFSLVIAGLCILVASFTKSYKEAQSALTPLSFVVMIPMFIYILGVELNNYLAFIPCLSHTMILNDILTVGFSNNLLISFIIMFISNIIYSYIIIVVITKIFKSERVLFG